MFHGAPTRVATQTAPVGVHHAPFPFQALLLPPSPECHAAWLWFFHAQKRQSLSCSLQPQLLLTSVHIKIEAPATPPAKKPTYSQKPKMMHRLLPWSKKGTSRRCSRRPKLQHPLCPAPVHVERIFSLMSHTQASDRRNMSDDTLRHWMVMYVSDVEGLDNNERHTLLCFCAQVLFCMHMDRGRDRGKGGRLKLCTRGLVIARH